MSSAYFKKMRENDSNIFYAYGSDAQALTSELIFEKQSRRPTVAVADLGYTGRKAAGQIVQLFMERGEWPENSADAS
jgi:hypothetical protein